MSPDSSHTIDRTVENDVEYLDDFEAGRSYELGSFTLTETEIIDFATRFDPQAFHVDPEAAKDSMFGGLIASGWHTVACVMRLMVDNLIPAKSALGSPGIDKLRWLKPVRPGIEYRAVYTVDSVRDSTSKPDRGLITTTTDLYDPDGEKVMTFSGVGMYLKRPADD